MNYFFWIKKIYLFLIFFANSNLNFFETLENWHFRDMTGREYDNMPNFQNVSFPLGFNLQNNSLANFNIFWNFLYF